MSETQVVEKQHKLCVQ